MHIIDASLTWSERVAGTMLGLLAAGPVAFGVLMEIVRIIVVDGEVCSSNPCQPTP